MSEKELAFFHPQQPQALTNGLCLFYDYYKQYLHIIKTSAEYSRYKVNNSCPKSLIYFLQMQPINRHWSSSQKNLNCSNCAVQTQVFFFLFCLLISFVFYQNGIAYVTGQFEKNELHILVSASFLQFGKCYHSEHDPGSVPAGVIMVQSTVCVLETQSAHRYKPHSLTQLYGSFKGDTLASTYAISCLIFQLILDSGKRKMCPCWALSQKTQCTFLQKIQLIKFLLTGIYVVNKYIF